MFHYNKFYVNQRGETADIADFGGGGSGAILMNNLLCDGGEFSITDCLYRIDNDCTHNQDSAVRCFDNDPELECTDKPVISVY